MQYIVSGYIGFDNFGDEAIAASLVQKLKKDGAEKITLISSNPKKTAELHGVNSCGMLNFFFHLKQADILISGGGSLLQDVTSIKSLIYYLLVISVALMMHKKVVIYAQGIGPINSIIGQILTKNILKRVDEISVRDKNSQNLLKSWGIESELVKDPVLNFEITPKNEHGLVGIQLRQYNGVTEKFLRTLADEVSQRFSNKIFKVFSLQDDIDLDVCKHFVELLKIRGVQNVELLNGLNINEVITQISGLEYLVSMRFHANVIGLKAGVKTLAINYDPKVQSLAEEYKLPLINIKDENFSKEFDKLVAS